MKKLLLLLTLVTALATSCSNRDEDSTPNGVFIEVNGDTRNPSLSNTTGYQINLSSFNFNENSSEPAGIQFVMDIYDINRKYIGGIAGIQSCVEIELFVDVFKVDFYGNETVQTFLTANTKEEKEGKANIFIRFKDSSDHRILSGTAIDGQNIKIEKRNGEFYVFFENLNFKSTDGDDFTASSRIITN